MRESVLISKSKKFALRIIKMYTYLRDEKSEYVMSRQILKSGTSIGANIAESIYAQSEMDFVNKLSIARKEGSETLYWIDLLYESALIDRDCYVSISDDCDEIMKLLTSTIKSTLKKYKQ